MNDGLDVDLTTARLLCQRLIDRLAAIDVILQAELATASSAADRTAAYRRAHAAADVAEADEAAGLWIAAAATAQFQAMGHQ